MPEPRPFDPPGLTGLRELARAHPLAADALLALGVYGLTLLLPLVDDKEQAGPITPQGVVIGALVCSSLTFRRRHPVPVLAFITAATAGYLVSGGPRSPLLLGTMIALYTCALRGSRRETLATCAGVAALLAGASALFGDRWWLGPDIIALVMQLAFASAVGDAVRNRRAYIAEVEERAHRAERTREEEARRRVIDERLRIARELHDVLAHHIALINVQAGVAAHVLETEPEQARQSLAHIRGAARSALEEVRTTIGLLRQPDAPVELAVEPSPGLDRLADLVAGHAAAGLVVDREVVGYPVELPPALDLTAYRIVQEALTNVSRHAAAPRAVLRLDYRPAELRIEVANPAGPGEPEQNGHGLTGMRERALAVGGSFRAGPAGGRFEVLAVLPYEGAGA